MQPLRTFLRHLRSALWRTFIHDGLGVAKGAAYSLILTMFPALMVAAAILATTKKPQDYLSAISEALGRVLPPGAAAAVVAYFRGKQEHSVPVLVAASLLTLWTASGVIISWMEGFRNAYQIPKTWGIVKERFISFGLVFMAGVPLTFATFLVAFGNQIESDLHAALGLELGPYVLLAWKALRWVIATLTSVAVMQLIYHNAVPRTLKWHTVLPGAALATAIWFPTTIFFGWYVGKFAQYSLFYGSLATSIVLLVWMYILSVIVLIGAEFNALLFPRPAAKPVTEMPAPKAAMEKTIADLNSSNF